MVISDLLFSQTKPVIERNSEFDLGEPIRYGSKFKEKDEKVDELLKRSRERTFARAFSQEKYIYNYKKIIWGKIVSL